MVVLSSACRADQSRYEPGYDPGLGFNLISWQNFGASGEAVWQAAIQDMYDHGFRHVSVCPVRFFDTTSGAIADSSPQGPELSHIAAGIALAKSLGMTVTVNPFIEPEGFAFWRANWNPTPGSDAAVQFWADYQRYLLDVAAIAEANGIDRLTIGTELRDIMRNSGHNASVTALIDAVNAVYTGQLGYAANWDNYNNPNLTANVWDHPSIDFIGVDMYFSLTTDAQADASGPYPDWSFINTVTNAWRQQLNTIVIPFVRSLKGGQGMPLVMTESGLTPFNRTTVAPWSENFGYNQPVDQGEQINGYKGLLNATDGWAYKLEEIQIWHWGMPGAENSFWFVNPNGVDDLPGSKFDESLGNPAAQFLSDYAMTALPGAFTVSASIELDWVYQNTFGSWLNGGHKVRLAVEVSDYGENDSVTVTAVQVPGSGPGVVIIVDDPSGDPLVKNIFGGLRSDGTTGTGLLTVRVTVTGNVSGQETFDIPLEVRPLGDLDGNGGVEPLDVSVMVMKLNGLPPAGIPDQAFDLDANGGAEPQDVQIIINILNGLAVP